MTSLLLAWLFSGNAQAFDGVGWVVSEVPFFATHPDAAGTGFGICGGFTGFEQPRATRTGLEVQGCASNNAVLAFAGVALSVQTAPMPSVYGIAQAGLGGGALALDMGSEEYLAMFLYARPRFGVGFPIGRGAVELSAYGMLPVVVGQQLTPSLDPNFTFPHGGIELSVLFGNFGVWERGPRRNLAPPPERVEDEQPLAIPEDEKPLAMPEDEKPLAIPEDTKPPPPKTDDSSE